MPEGPGWIGECLQGERNRYLVAAAWREADTELYQVVTPKQEVLLARPLRHREDLLHAALLGTALPDGLLPTVRGLDRVGDAWLLLAPWREGLPAQKIRPRGGRLRALTADAFWLLSRLEERGWVCESVCRWQPRWDGDRRRWWFRTLGTCRPLHPGERPRNWRAELHRLLASVTEPEEWRRCRYLWRQEAAGPGRNVPE